MQQTTTATAATTATTTTTTITTTTTELTLQELINNYLATLTITTATTTTPTTTTTTTTALVMGNYNRTAIFQGRLDGWHYSYDGDGPSFTDSELYYQHGPVTAIKLGTDRWMNSIQAR